MIAKGRDGLVEAGYLHSLGIHLWLRNLQLLPNCTAHWQILWWSAEGKCAWSRWTVILRSLSRIKLPVNPRAKGGINNIADLRAQWHQGHATLQQNVSWWSGSAVALLQQEEIGCHIFRKQLKRESVPYLPIYWFIKLFFYAKMLDGCLCSAFNNVLFFFFFTCQYSQINPTKDAK